MDDANRSDIEVKLRKALNEARTLRDEGRLKIDLASMDARDAWSRLEPKLLDAERDAIDVSRDALERVEKTLRQLRELVASL